jgi:lipoyl(octanoyl) transferase
MLLVRKLGLVPYPQSFEAMKQYTRERTEASVDELWLLEHPPVYTQGQAGKAKHLLNPGDIPVIQSDRGGQVTYHGPGQLLAYILVDLKRRNLGIRTLVCQLEQLIIKLLQDFNIDAQTRCGAPGVYVAEKKIASLGLRVKNACTYHGLALNVAMDLEPFSRINPCGFEQLQMTQIKDFQADIRMAEVSDKLEKMVLAFF